MVIQAKIVLLGDPAVGKTTLRDVFMGHPFERKYLPTLGADYLSKNVRADQIKQIVKLQIWDLAGQSSFREVRRLYYRNAVGALLIFDITNLKTLKNLEFWCEELLLNSKAKSITIGILGNKKDKKEEFVDDGQVDIQISKLIQKTQRINSNAFYLKTSAKTGENVETTFKKLADGILSNYVM
ncbi:MAG: Rab family GTPase [Candidatus Hodarchaeales archaeon]